MASPFEGQVREDVKEAMRAAQKERLGVLRMLLAALKNEEIAKGRELTDEDCLGVVSKAVKQRKDSVAQYRLGGREDLAVKEEAEIAILQRYLPAQLTADDVRAMVRELVATGAGNVGAVMKQLSPRIKGRFDGAEANRIVREVLGG
jgi:hypothetical protein